MHVDKLTMGRGEDLIDRFQTGKRGLKIVKVDLEGNISSSSFHNPLF